MIGGPAHPPTMTSANVRPVQKRDCPGRRWHSISATAASQAAAVHSPVQRDQVEARLAAARETVETISANMDQNVLGHDQVKRGVLLALLAREHVYIEGTWHTISLIFFFPSGPRLFCDRTGCRVSVLLDKTANPRSLHLGAKFEFLVQL